MGPQKNTFLNENAILHIYGCIYKRDMVLKNIIFDLGGVIIHIDHSLSQKAFEQMGISEIKENFSHFNQAKLFDHLETGIITPTDFYEGIRKQTTKGLTDYQIEAAFNKLLIGIPEGSYFDLLTNLRSNYRTFLLSNNNRIHYNWIIDYMQWKWQLPSLSRFFEQEYYSHLVGMRKPNAEIFELVLNREKLVPEETIFIDDTIHHIVTANELGIHTYLKRQDEHLADVLGKIL